MDENRPVERLPQTIGRYQVQGSVGFGAMGAVYKAFDPLIKRTLAIKTIRLDIPRQSPQYKSFLDRFYHEARISGTLSHPNIVTLFDIGEEQEIPYLAMEYVEGETIASMLERGVKFDPERVIGLVSQMAAAIDYAHSRGVIHRDIKPSNLILAEGDRVKVTDFGIAKLADAEMTQSGALLGTPSYMSPEQAMGDKLDGRSDIFSLGICAFEMLSGEQPFPGNNVTSILYKLVHVDPVEPPNLELNGLVPQKWHEVFGKVLAKKPDDRYQNGAAFVQDLEYCLGSWFGSAMGDEGAGGGPATVIMKAPEPPPEPTAAIPRPASVAPAATAATSVPEVRRSSTSPVPTEEPTVLMRAPMPAPVAAPTPVAEPEPATILMKAPAPPPDEPTARFPKPPVPVAPARVVTPPPVETTPVPRPEVAPVASGAPAVPAARSGGRSMMPLIIGGVVTLVVLAGIALVLIKLIFSRTSIADAPPTPAPTATAAAPTPAPTLAPTVAPVAAGIMHVESDPVGATVFLNGESKGVAPVDLTGLELGTHEVRAELAGYEAKSQSIELTAEAPETKLVLALATPAPTWVNVDITSTPPGAAVTIDGRAAGVTPLTGLTLKPGTHKVEMRKEGYDPFTTSTRLVGGKPRKIDATLVAEAKPTPPPTPKPDVFDPNRIYEEDQVDTAPKKAKGDSPSYPDKAPKLRSGESVSVQVSWIVSETGETTDFKIVGSGGKVVDDAVVETLRKQRFKPGLKMGKPVKVRITRTYIFRAG
jgi:TonB family protein